MSIKDQILAFPELFRPMDLKARLVYPDLSEHKFTSEQKNQFLDEVVITLSQIPGASFASICRDYQISYEKARHWNRNIKRGDPLHESEGRPTAINEKEILKVREVQ
jgi:hypothetical protein